MDIRDGHHTFQARKDLGLEIYYIVLDSNDAFDMDITRQNYKCLTQQPIP